MSGVPGETKGPGSWSVVWFVLSHEPLGDPSSQLARTRSSKSAAVDDVSLPDATTVQIPADDVVVAVAAVDVILARGRPHEVLATVGTDVDCVICPCEGVIPVVNLQPVPPAPSRSPPPPPAGQRRSGPSRRRKVDYHTGRCVLSTGTQAGENFARVSFDQPGTSSFFQAVSGRWPSSLPMQRRTGH